MKRDPSGVSNPAEVPYLNAKKFPIFATSAAQAKAQGWVCRVAARRQRAGTQGDGSARPGPAQSRRRLSSDPLGYATDLGHALRLL